MCRLTRLRRLLRLGQVFCRGRELGALFGGPPGTRPRSCQLNVVYSPSFTLVQQTGEEGTDECTSADKKQHHRQQTLEVKKGRLQTTVRDIVDTSHSNFTTYHRTEHDRDKTAVSWFRVAVSGFAPSASLKAPAQWADPPHG